MIAEIVRERVLNACKGERNTFGPVFFEEHLLVVREYSDRLAKILGADADRRWDAGRSVSV